MLFSFNIQIDTKIISEILNFSLLNFLSYLKIKPIEKSNCSLKVGKRSNRPSGLLF